MPTYTHKLPEYKKEMYKSESLPLFIITKKNAARVKNVTPIRIKLDKSMYEGHVDIEDLEEAVVDATLDEAQRRPTTCLPRRLRLVDTDPPQ